MKRETVRAAARATEAAATKPTEVTPETYPAFLAELKQRIRTARLKASLSVNRELVLLYWAIGRDILARQNNEGWGAKVIDRLAIDLRRSFPDMKGLSGRSLKYMRAFAEAWPKEQIVQQVAAQLPWGHLMQLLDSVKCPVQREWYAPEVRERELEQGLIQQVRSLILELGKGFAFVGSQYPLEVGGQDFYLDLLFYHLRLRCFVVFELKVEAFRPEFAGKMNFYLSAIDDLLRHPGDNPSIGIILCRGRNEVIVEYALRDSGKPMGVAKYQLSAALPERLRKDLPTVEDLAAVAADQRSDFRTTPPAQPAASADTDKSPQGHRSSSRTSPTA
jgi:predicted nuclease of restriction endonuclease-like (RecB) superfamily